MRGQNGVGRAQKYAHLLLGHRADRLVDVEAEVDLDDLLDGDGLGHALSLEGRRTNVGG